MQQPEKLQAIHDRHMDIDHQQVNRASGQNGEGLSGFVGQVNLPIGSGIMPHQFLERLQKMQIVIDE